MTRASSDGFRLGAGVGAVAGITFIYVKWLDVSNAATVSTTFLMIVLFVAATSRLWVAVVTSIVAMLSFNFWFLPPAGTLTIADPQNWVALLAFLAVSLVASNLSAVARARTTEAVGRRDELARLFDLSRDVLVITDSREAIAVLARAIARRFDLEYVAIALPRSNEWDVIEAGAETIAMDTRQLAAAFATAQTSLEFDAYARTYAGHRTMEVDGRTIRLVPLRVGTKPIGLLAAAGRPIEAGTLDALGGVVAIAIERAQFLEERKAGELTRQSEELKTALLASVGHDLRTPLTAIRVAATNIQASSLTADDRLDQSNLILSEVERLTRLFQNILEMARIDAGGIVTESRWTHPSEIVAAARDQVDQTLHEHKVNVDVDPDAPVRLDPRLTATALAHLLENAAQYAPSRSDVYC
jgi:two-component system, OmpR family, sensor histidine kinase KdpD